MIYAEKSTGKVFSKKFEWSPKLKQAVQAFRYWKLRLKATRGGFVSASRLEHHRETALLPVPTDLTESQIIAFLQAASTDLKEFQRQHKLLWSTYLEDLAEAIVVSQAPHLNGDSMEQVRKERQRLQLQRLHKRETSRRLYRKIGKILKPHQNTGLSRVDVPDYNAESNTTGTPNDPKLWQGPWKTITNPMELASIIKEINRKQYHQAHTTPFGSGLLAQQLGHRGNTAAALALLNGTLPSVAPSLLPETQRILQTLARNHPTIPDSSVITAQDFQDSYKLAKEATSSSPSGRHIGHYKAVVADLLTKMHAAMMSIPFQTGIVPE
jgi:hypothetical protein